MKRNHKFCPRCLLNLQEYAKQKRIRLSSIRVKKNQPEIKIPMGEISEAITKLTTSDLIKIGVGHDSY